MSAIYPIIGCFVNFLTDPVFQERVRWVNFLISNVKWIHHHIWTSVRIPAGFLIIYLLAAKINPLIIFGLFILFALTDWFDGKVYRMRRGIFALPMKVVALETSKFGSFLDGLADKFFVLPVIWYLGSYFSNQYVLFSLCLIEGGGNVLIWILQKKGLIKRHGNIFEHLYIGKLKFGLQVFLVCLLWLAVFFDPNWIWWKLWINVLLGIIIMLAYFSIACKIKKENERFIPDFVTAGNLVCGAFSIYFAFRDLKIAAALVIIGGICDALDGSLARKFKKNSEYGILADDAADITTFGLAPARLVMAYGLIFHAALLYAAFTFVRLAKFTVDKMKLAPDGYFSDEAGVKERSQFKGLPCPAAAIMIASLVLWEKILPAPIILVVTLVCSVMMVAFNLKWYHFINARDLPFWFKVITSLFFVAMFLGGKIGEALTLLSLCYFFLFQKNVAKKLWRWE